MVNTEHNYAVLFADVAGSTHIYEKLGDTQASKIVNSVLQMMTDTVQQYGGTLVKTIGDEVMVRFDHAESAVEAACQFNKKLNNTPPIGDIKLAVRTGIHWGPALLQADGDLLGDVVNVAARMTGIAQARQIITTADTYSNISDVLQYKCREFDRSEVKGKSEMLVIYEVVWEPQDVTRMAPIIDHAAQSSTTDMEIIYQNFHRKISPSSPPLLMGRGEQCDLVVQSPLASRSHATLKFNRGKFILVDQSTNGTFVRFNMGKQFYLRRENLPLSESGIISLGENVEVDNTHHIIFKV